jgi:UDP-N-acetylglucosamine 1-carboxyvinyltransferase
VRAAAALVIAGLAAVGETVLDGLDRGYDRMSEKLAACGAQVMRSGD